MQDVDIVDEKAEVVKLVPDVVTNLKFQAAGDYFCNIEEFPHKVDDRYEAGAAFYDYLMGLEIDDLTEEEVLDLIAEEKDGFCPEVYAPYGDMPLVHVLKLAYDHYHNLKTFFLRNYVMQAGI